MDSKTGVSEEMSDGSLIGVGLTINHLVGNSIERLNEDIGRRYARLPEKFGGPFVAR